MTLDHFRHFTLFSFPLQTQGRPVRRVAICLARIILVIALLVPTTELSAQKVQNANLHGYSVVAIANGMFQVERKHGHGLVQWVIKPQGISQYLGTASKDWLRPGMIVMVTASFDDDGKATAPVSSVQAFTPRPGRTVGIEEDSSAENEATTYVLAGPIQSIESNNLIIAGGRKKSFTVSLAEDTEVIVDLLGDLTWVQVGDSVDGKVKYMQKGQGMGTEIKVTGKKPLAPPPPAPLSKKEQRAKARREKIAAAAAAKAGAAASEDEKEVIAEGGE